MQLPRFAVTHHSSEYRGDHAADVCYAIETPPGETIEALVSRLLTTVGDPDEEPRYSFGDHLEIRLVRPAPEPAS